MTWRIEHGDCESFLAGLHGGAVDLIVTDPAYESLEKHRAVGTTTRLTGQWFPIFRNERFGDFFRECYRVLARDAHLYCFCDEETLQYVRAAGVAAGFAYWKAIVWDKQAIGMGYHYRNAHEFIAFFEKGKRRLADLGIGSILRHKRIRGGHPTEKPVDLLRVLVGQSSSPGELVVDPFCGSGSAGEAAVSMGRRFIGCDIQQAAVDIATRRLENTTLAIQEVS